MLYESIHNIFKDSKIILKLALFSCVMAVFIICAKTFFLFFLDSPSLILTQVNRYLSLSFTQTWKKCFDMFSENNAAHPVGCGSLLLTIWLFGALQIFKKPCQKSVIICSGLSQPTRSLSRIVYRQEGPTGNKGTLRPDFQAKTRSRLFLKPMSPQETGRRL